MRECAPGACGRHALLPPPFHREPRNEIKSSDTEQSSILTMALCHGHFCSPVPVRATHQHQIMHAGGVRASSRGSFRPKAHQKSPLLPGTATPPMIIRSASRSQKRLQPYGRRVTAYWRGRGGSRTDKHVEAVVHPHALEWHGRGRPSRPRRDLLVAWLCRRVERRRSRRPARFPGAPENNGVGGSCTCRAAGLKPVSEVEYRFAR